MPGGVDVNEAPGRGVDVLEERAVERHARALQHHALLAHVAVEENEEVRFFCGRTYIEISKAI